MRTITKSDASIHHNFSQDTLVHNQLQRQLLNSGLVAKKVSVIALGYLKISIQMVVEFYNVLGELL